MFDLINMLLGRETQHDKDIRKAFYQGHRLGIEEGVESGLKKHFNITSELSQEEDELVKAFCTKHDFEFCYDPMQGGFRIRKNKSYTKNKEKVVYIPYNIDEGRFEMLKKSLVKHELEQLRDQNSES
jgi:hypothetical protein